MLIEFSLKIPLNVTHAIIRDSRETGLSLGCNPLYTCILLQYEDPDEMLQNVAFHQHLHCLLKFNMIFVCLVLNDASTLVGHLVSDGIKLNIDEDGKSKNL